MNSIMIILKICLKLYMYIVVVVEVTLVAFCFFPELSQCVQALGKSLNTEFLSKIQSNKKCSIGDVPGFDTMIPFPEA